MTHTMSKRVCVNDPDKFGYICDKYIFDKQVLDINEFVKKSYYDYIYFKRQIQHQDKNWEFHIRFVNLVLRY